MSKKSSFSEPNFFRFLRATYAFESVLRAPKVVGRESKESDAEHSYQLAMTVWYLASIKDYGFSIEKLIKYALVHDLVELYAGDTDTYASTSDFAKSKHERELASLARLKSEFPEFSEMTDLIDKYESRSEPEARFVYAIDKLLPFANAYFYGQKDYYQINKISFKKWHNNLQTKIISVGGESLYQDEYIQDFVTFFRSLENFFYEE